MARRRGGELARSEVEDLETEHFYVHYYAGEEHAAERTAMVAERAYERLVVDPARPVP